MTRLEIGTRVYYTGDQVNIEGYGTITGVKERDNYSPLRYEIKMDDGREKTVYNSDFSPGAGRRFWPAEEYKAKRQEEMERFLERIRKTA